ncbi:ribosomal protein S18 acetylase RimI-like enzyme [Kribbella aluminosa]|uniref:Ribosomal protein S18 acetylase RimI-like enzyme n=1 Tax=Kribbella aluminosa TaxID=416017 RepID=A0ABS4V042_9ACTN|nr:GNAT family N-acetyltransferase [Kribbella aluminosa]MBP2357227.1 ribosomal protein S18 acetylase RimI-like enzyme [Kribbella aluminosa]
MTAVLPEKYTVRPPTTEDARTILELVSAYNTSVIGFADWTLDDAVDGLTDESFDPARDGWLVFEGDRPAGFGWVAGKGDRRQLDQDVVADDLALERWLLDRVEERARELGREYGQSVVQLDAVAYQADTARRDRLAGYGYARGTVFHRMRIVHDGPVAAPEVPAGVTVRRGTPDEASRRAAHGVLNAAFDGQFGFTPRSFEEWQASQENHSAFDWSQLTLLEVDGEAVAMLAANDQFVEDEDCGYVGRLAVLEKARGRGLAKFLLRDQFAVDAANGRAGTILHVDTNNPTPALGVYLSVGMQAVLVMEVWRLEVAV